MLMIADTRKPSAERQPTQPPVRRRYATHHSDHSHLPTRNLCCNFLQYYVLGLFSRQWRRESILLGLLIFRVYDRSYPVGARCVEEIQYDETADNEDGTISAQNPCVEKAGTREEDRR